MVFFQLLKQCFRTWPLFIFLEESVPRMTFIPVATMCSNMASVHIAGRECSKNDLHSRCNNVFERGLCSYCWKRVFKEWPSFPLQQCVPMLCRASSLVYKTDRQTWAAHEVFSLKLEHEEHVEQGPCINLWKERGECKGGLYSSETEHMFKVCSGTRLFFVWSKKSRSFGSFALAHVFLRVAAGDDPEGPCAESFTYVWVTL
jgi:hypothetical protein